MSGDPTQALPVLHALSGAVGVRAIYPATHPRVRDAIQRFAETLGSCLRERKAEEVTFYIVDRELLVDERPTRGRQAHLATLIRTLSKLGVERVTLAAGADEEECHGLVDALVGAGELRSTGHVTLGRIQLADEAAPEHLDAAVPALGARSLSERDVDCFEESFVRFDGDRRGSIEELDRMIWRFVEGIDRTGRNLLMLGPMRSASQRLFVHSINVALLTMAQARGLGLQDRMLHDIGLAALLHDVGKLSLPRELIDKRERYGDMEWEMVKRHPEIGAAQLAGLEGAPPLAVIVAYEHHLRWDGKPSVPEPASPRLPNVVSQMTAISDTYDVLIASRGLDGGVGGEAAMRIWQERSGSWLDPFLVGNFVMTLSPVEHR